MHTVVPPVSSMTLVVNSIHRGAGAGPAGPANAGPMFTPKS